VKFKTANGDEEQSVGGSMVKQVGVRHREVGKEGQVKESSHSKLENLQNNDDHITEEQRDYIAPPPPPSTATSDNSVTNNKDSIDRTNGCMEDADSSASPEPRKSLTVRRASFSGQESTLESPKLRRSFRKRRSTYSGRDSLLHPVSELQPLCPDDDLQYQPMNMEMNQLHMEHSLSVGQQYDSQAPKDDVRKYIARDSLHIAQPAKRVARQAELQHIMEMIERRDGEHIQTSELTSSKHTRKRIKENVVPISNKERVQNCERGNVYSPASLERDQADYYLNHEQAKINLPFPPRPVIKSMVTPEQKGKINSVGAELIANLTSAWYWSGYYAGYQQRITEE